MTRSHSRLRRALLGVVAVALTAVPATAAGAATPSWAPYQRPAQNGVTVQRDLTITMRDGTVLSANLQRPDKAGRYPVIIIQTPYNKDGAINIALGGSTDAFARRGYAVLTVDVRGTGGSQGVWEAMGEAEQRDGPEVVEWAAGQPWSDGKVGLFGPSYMALNQLLTAAQRPPHLKAIFPIVPMGDAYRDIVFSGGQLNASFIPLWLGLVTAGGITPPTYAASGSSADLLRSLTTLASHAAGAVSFQSRLVAETVAGASTAYDGPFWRHRSPLEVVDKIDVPAFVVGGHHDLFQRGEPLIYERLKRHVPARLLMGPWTHLGGSTGQGLPRDGVPTLDSIALRWFDQYLKGIDTKVRRIPKVTQFVYGADRYETQPDWPDPRLKPTRLYLRGGHRLAAEAPGAGEAAQIFTQHPLSGICTQSTSQWTAGATEPIPCTTDNRLHEALGNATYTTAPMQGDLQLSGPVLADLWVKTTARDALVTVRVTDVAPDGRSTELTTGWLAGSFRALDAGRSRMVRGRLLQPWHPFTKASVLPVTPGQATRLPVEVFPVRAVIRKGHRLRVTVSPSDFPHQLPPAPQLAGSLLGRVSILTAPGHASFVELPGLGGCAAGQARTGTRSTRARCATLPTPLLISGRH
jgi:putative CocE/NonD family hydrolase